MYGVRVGIYMIAFTDCPHCWRLLSYRRFRQYMNYLQSTIRSAVFRVIWLPRDYPGTSYYEFIPDDMDRCIAEYAQFLARTQGFGYLNYDVGYWWLERNTMSPLFLLVPPDPREPILLPIELQERLLGSKPGQEDWEVVMRWMVNYITNRLYVPPLEKRERPTSTQ
jgi:hypothetical protein